jgi:hypothetical protein
MSGLEYPGVLYSNKPHAPSKRPGIFKAMLNPLGAVATLLHSSY